MQDELKNVISQAMNNSSESEQEHIAASAEELSDKALDAVAGGCCFVSTIIKPCIAWSVIRNANNKV
ncbi:hypothetical protein SAMD00079811_02720 [Scytonema sp. HK-05]|uniref:hypothetical protein n=1 Tax=Scytonema sp. HK-05 TaxID=1137095 RepID=UPI000935F38A|nr:hypothetical protein [Scytonema sp. HK-05]OKH60008.1 hypothetical protein NIES2130_06010 [Scytonema sp. HK-05]BAY42694.1 hypothetical protein SAMD00079811_02720 [Scytonema sp. HK-05]